MYAKSVYHDSSSQPVVEFKSFDDRQSFQMPWMRSGEIPGEAQMHQAELAVLTASCHQIRLVMKQWGQLIALYAKEDEHKALGCLMAMQEKVPMGSFVWRESVTQAAQMLCDPQGPWAAQKKTEVPVLLTYLWQQVSEIVNQCASFRKPLDAETVALEKRLARLVGAPSERRSPQPVPYVV